MIDKSKIGSISRPPVTTDGAQSNDAIRWEDRIYFATLALQNVQELNARADSKAYLVLTANGFLITFLGWMVSAVQHVWQQGLTPGVIAHIIATAALILTVAMSLNHAFHVMSPRLKQADNAAVAQEHGTHLHPANLLFFVDIVRAHHTDQEYTEALANASPEELLANLASSIYGSSVSAQEKYRAAHQSISALRPVLVAWVVFVGLTFALS